MSDYTLAYPFAKSKDVIKSMLNHYKMVLWYLENTTVSEIEDRIKALEKELAEANKL
jgi:hypothetical protein